MNAKKQVAEKIKSLFPTFNVEEFPFRRGQMHLLVSNPESGKQLRLRVGNSRNYLDANDVVNEDFRPHLQYSGWWTFDPAEINKTSADTWVLIWPDAHGLRHALIFTFAELSRLLKFGCAERANGQKDFYWYIPNEGSNFAARPLGTKGIKDVLEGTSTLDANLNLDPFVDSWQTHIGDVLN